MDQIKFSISGMHCSSCAMSIDGELEDTEGVKEAATNFAKSETRVTFDKGKVTEEKIMKIIEEVGYKAQIVK